MAIDENLLVSDLVKTRTICVFDSWISAGSKVWLYLVLFLVDNWCLMKFENIRVSGAFLTNYLGMCTHLEHSYKHLTNLSFLQKFSSAGCSSWPAEVTFISIVMQACWATGIRYYRWTIKSVFTSYLVDSSISSNVIVCLINNICFSQSIWTRILVEKLNSRV